MTKPKVLFHGSKHEIKGFLEPREATDTSSKANAQKAVYATDRFECAAGMSLTGEQWSFADYREREFKVVFVDKPPTAKIKRFVYKLSADTFEEKPISSHQWGSKVKVPILKTYIYFTEELIKYWRMATDEEREKMHRLYPERISK